ncbi:MAG: secretion protein [Candidatus Altiarchaeales archaeon HGW-Altiarchaeales-3]|nr:MAG: secretion protein [Candidatus Altiarchaeales archaeon HGW-Altiarchaeales-3]
MARKIKEKDSYSLKIGPMPVEVKIVDVRDYVLHYNLSSVKIGAGTKIMLDDLKGSLAREVEVEIKDMLDPRMFNETKVKFIKRAQEKILDLFPGLDYEKVKILASLTVGETMELGVLEYLLADDNLEEIVINQSNEPVWVYHRKYAWLKTNILFPDEDAIGEYSARIARQVGKEITSLEPLLDAHLISGDRVNATLFPISSQGNTITIRRFSRTPWTMIHMIRPQWNTISAEASAFLWLAIEYEFSMVVAGGTGSGKTSILNALMPFFPPNQRILTIEDTRELQLPEYSHWVPMTTRPANPHGGGEISMLDLMVNALRQRPDRIVVGEVRAKRETEIMFEAMHTGHSTYASFHAERAKEVVDRITNPPMSIPGTVLGSLHLICVQYRNRRTGIRRTFEIAELVKKPGGGLPDLNVVYQWNPTTDYVEAKNPSIRLKEELEEFVGITDREITANLEDKTKILKWMFEHEVMDIASVGKIIAEYYRDTNIVMQVVNKNKDPLELL